MAKNYYGKLIFSKHRKVKYPVGMFGFLEGDCSTVSSSPLHSATNLSIFSHVPDADEFSADLVVVVLSIEVSGPANLLKPWMKRR